MKFSNGHIVILLAAAAVVAATVGYFLLAPATDTGVHVSVVYDQSCTQCPSANPVINSFAANGVNITKWNNYDYNSSEGSALIEKYGVERVPAIIITQNFMDYDYAKQTFSSVNFTKANDSFIIYLNPPYRNLSANRINGIVDVYFINDSSCKECYNVLLHKVLLEEDFKIAFGGMLVFDINFPAGQEFVDRYNITLVPTVILTGDAGYYPSLVRAWKSAGTIEPNGYFIFRNFSSVKLPYKNLTSGKIVNSTG